MYCDNDGDDDDEINNESVIGVHYRYTNTKYILRRTLCKDVINESQQNYIYEKRINIK